MRNILIFLFVVIGVVLFVVIYRRRRNLIVNNATWDADTNKFIENLHPSIRDKAYCLINTAFKENIKLEITSGTRTFAEQTELYNQGRTTPGNIVTNARAGFSYHNYGLAFDVAPILNGKVDYLNADWNRIGQIGKNCGLEWGGDFISIVDKPHFQFTGGKEESELLARYNSGNFKSGFVNIT